MRDDNIKLYFKTKEKYLTIKEYLKIYLYNKVKFSALYSSLDCTKEYVKENEEISVMNLYYLANGIKKISITDFFLILKELFHQEDQICLYHNGSTLIVYPINKYNKNFLETCFYPFTSKAYSFDDFSNHLISTNGYSDGLSFKEFLQNIGDNNTNRELQKYEDWKEDNNKKVDFFEDLPPLYYSTIKVCTTVEDVILDYYKEQAPKTYINKDCTGDYQCSNNRNRSVQELYRICKGFLPELKFKEFCIEFKNYMNKYVLDNKKRLVIWLCGDIKRLTILSGEKYTENMGGYPTHNNKYFYKDWYNDHIARKHNDPAYSDSLSFKKFLELIEEPILNSEEINSLDNNIKNIETHS